MHFTYDNSFKENPIIADLVALNPILVEPLVQVRMLALLNTHLDHQDDLLMPKNQNIASINKT